MADQPLSPGGGGQPFWGLNDAGQSPNQAPLFFTDPWDTFWIGTRQVPGECTLSPGSVIAVEVIKKKGKGRDGARVTLGGTDPKTFTVEIEITTAEQWAELQDIEDVFWRTPGKSSSLSQASVSVYHPDLASRKIYAAALVDVLLMKPARTEGGKVRTWVFQVNVAPTKKNSTQTIGPPAEDPRQPASAELQNATPPPPSSVAENASTSGPPAVQAPGAS